MYPSFDYSYFDHYKNQAVEKFSEKLLIKKQAYIPPSDEADHAQSSFGLDLLILRFLQKGTLLKDSRSFERLNQEWVAFQSQHTGVSFALGDLIQNGWIRIVLGEWYIPQQFRFSGERIEPKSAHLYLFIEHLSSIQYAESRKVILQRCEDEIKYHRSFYKNVPSMDWFFEQELIVNEEEGFVLNMSHPYLHSYASFLAARLWEQTAVAGPEELDKRFMWWIKIYEMLHGGFDFFSYMNPTSQSYFLDACLNRLIKEKDCIDWKAESRKLVVEQTLDYHDIELLSDLPEQKDRWNELRKLEWLASIDKTETGRYLDRPRALLDLLFSWIVEHEQGEPHRLLRLIELRYERPYFYKLLVRHETIIPVLLFQEDTLPIGIYALAHYEPTVDIYWNEQTKLQQQKTARALWKEGLSFFAYTFHRLPNKKATAIVLEIAKWFYRDLRKPNLFSREGHIKRKRLLTSWLDMLLTMPIHYHRNGLWLSSIIPQLLSLIEARLTDSENPVQDESWPLLMWLFNVKTKRPDIDPQNTLNAFTKKMVNFYIKSIQYTAPYNSWIEVVEKEIESEGWVLIAEQVSKRDPILWQYFLYPTQFQSEFGETTLYDEERKVLTGRIRTHIRLHSYLFVQLQKKKGSIPMTDELSKMLTSYVSVFLEEQPKKGSIDIFHSHFEFNPLTGTLGADVPLFQRVAEAVNYFSDDQREQALQQILQKKLEPHRLSILLQTFSREKDKKSIREKLQNISIQEVSDSVAWLTEVQQTVTELLNTGETAQARIALEIINKFQKVARGRRLRDWNQWEFRERLRANLIMENYEMIFQTKLPTADKDEFFERILKFFQALSYLEKEHPEPERAIVLLEEMHRQEPYNWSYSVNLLVASIRLFEEKWSLDEGDDTLQQKITSLFEQLDSQAEGPEKLKIYAENRLYFYILKEEINVFWAYYNQLPDFVQKAIPIGVNAVQVLIKEERWEQAEFLLQSLYEWHGELEVLESLKESITEKSREMSAVFHPPSIFEALNHWQEIGTALQLFKTLSPNDQIRALLKRETASWKEFILNETFQACSLVEKYSPSLRTKELKQGEEDRYTDLLAMFLNQRIGLMDWKAETQSRGGWTKKPTDQQRGGIGERDLIIESAQQDELVLGEAFRLQDANKGVIMDHFQKVFGYDTTRCNFYIVLVWGYHDEPLKLWEKYKAIIKEWDTGDFCVQRSGAIKEVCPMIKKKWIPFSFYTTHQTNYGEEAQAIHIYVDVKNSAQIKIAEQART